MSVLECLLLISIPDCWTSTILAVGKLVSCLALPFLTLARVAGICLDLGRLLYILLCQIQDLYIVVVDCSICELLRWLDEGTRYNVSIKIGRRCAKPQLTKEPNVQWQGHPVIGKLYY